MPGKETTEAKTRQRARFSGNETVVRRLNREAFKAFIESENLYWEDVESEAEHVCDFMAQINQLQAYRAITMGLDVPSAYLSDAVLAKQVGRVFIRVYQLVDPELLDEAPDAV